MTDISDASRFYVRILGANQYDKVEAEMNKFSPLPGSELEMPIKKGTICAARFSIDNRWYRSRVIRSIGKGDYEVEFIDFGNIDVVNEIGLKKLPSHLLAIEP